MHDTVHVAEVAACQGATMAYSVVNTNCVSTHRARSEKREAHSSVRWYLITDKLAKLVVPAGFPVCRN